MTGSRTRLNIGTKMEILRLLDEGNRTQKSIAKQFNCGERTVRTVKADRAKIEQEAAQTRSSATTRKNLRAGDFPEVCMLLSVKCLLLFRSLLFGIFHSYRTCSKKYRSA